MSAIAGDNVGHRRRQEFVVAVPRVACMEMPLDTVLCPLVQLELHGSAQVLGL
jgi:hypothetical protein